MAAAILWVDFLHSSRFCCKWQDGEASKLRGVGKNFACVSLFAACVLLCVWCSCVVFVIFVIPVAKQDKEEARRCETSKKRRKRANS